MTIHEGTNVNRTTELHTVTCGLCAGTYALAQRYVDIKERDGGFWNCPYCRCSWGYPKERSTVQKLQAKLDAEQTRRQRAEEAAENAENRRRAQKAATSRMKNRIFSGMCPCCDRYFRELDHHMLTEHAVEREGTQLRAVRKHRGLTQAALAKELDIPPGYVSMFEHEKPSLPPTAHDLIKDWLRRTLGTPA